jgi:myo-inositol-1(or 4)-monophosphatase
MLRFLCYFTWASQINVLSLVSQRPFTFPGKNSLLSQPTNDLPLQNVAQVAEQAAREAGAIINAGMAGIELKSKIGQRDIVTDADVKCQAVIKDVILTAFPSHKFLGEEDVPPGRDAATVAVAELSQEEHLWIVDPIDGTSNFAASMPLSGVIIAYASRGRSV